ncbi:ABC transporter ATP-binding protein [Ignisphaera sp. 4213-co]|uniref:ABC transporter ATP-binding protein n=1 Tax=Ignisphaera cupida TaxID=3050454 RepID=A0ABD4Z967_9CREN|nr:ABC transporter ATP-binding protein [Ignisphaera sp. 4213-co]MDK6028628.1 ABC transporter ATP-binding protein [Ignisphaera sp. 4213-co]
MAIIKVIDVEVRYNSVKALNGVSFEINEGEIVSIVGPNGAGKTTLLKTIDAIVKPTKGSVYIDMKNVFDFSRRELAKMLCLVPQHINIAPGMKVIDFVLTGRRPHIDFMPTKKDVEISINALKSVKAEQFIYRDLTELSSGELQRVLIARALASEPRILLLDEPTANLDLRFQIDILNLIKSLSKEKSLTVIMSLHDLTQAYRFSDKVILMNKGEIYSVGTPEEVLNERIIEEVYGVKVKVDKNLKAIIPLQ